MFDFLDLKIEDFGLDINDLSLKVVKLKTRGKKTSLVSYGEERLSPGIIKEGIIQDEKALGQAIRRVCRKVKGERLKTSCVIVSLPEEETFLQVIQMPKMTDEELKTAVPLEAENYIPMPVDQVYLDFDVIGWNKDGRLDVLIVAMPKKVVDSYVSCIKAAGLVPIALEAESQAIARALVKEGVADDPIMLVDLGKDTAEFVVFYGKTVTFTNSISFLEEGIEFKKAEITDGKSEILELLAMQLMKYADFYKDHAIGEKKEIKKIIFCGGGSDLKGLSEFMAKRIGIPCETGNPFLNFYKSPKKTMSDAVSFTTAIGLALRHAGKNNFYD